MSDVYVYSTLSCDQVYANHIFDGNGVARPELSIFIAGQANIANTKSMHTPLGVATKVTAEDLAELKRNDMFKLHMENGFIKVGSTREDPDVVAADMEGRDGSAPLVEQDFKEEEKPTKAKKGKR